MYRFYLFNWPDDSIYIKYRYDPDSLAANTTIVIVLGFDSRGGCILLKKNVLYDCHNWQPDGMGILNLIVN